MAEERSTLQLNEEDIAYVLTLLRNASSPLTTEQVIEALRQRPGR